MTVFFFGVFLPPPFLAIVLGGAFFAGGAFFTGFFFLTFKGFGFGVSAFAAASGSASPFPATRGRRTTSAVRRFQRDRGLTEDGEFGPKTAIAISQALAEAKAEGRPVAGLKVAASPPTTSAVDDKPKKAEIKTIKRVMSFGVSTGVRPPKKKK